MIKIKRNSKLTLDPSVVTNYCAGYSKTLQIGFCFSVVRCSENGACSWGLGHRDFLRHRPCSREARATPPNKVKSRLGRRPSFRSVIASTIPRQIASPQSLSPLVDALYYIRVSYDVKPRLPSFSGLLDSSILIKLKAVS